MITDQDKKNDECIVRIGGYLLVIGLCTFLLKLVINPANEKEAANYDIAATVFACLGGFIWFMFGAVTLLKRFRLL